MSGKIRLILFLSGLSLLSFLIWRVGFSETVKIISEAKLYYLVLGVFAYLALIFVRSLKWFLLAGIIGNRVSYRRFVPFYLVNSLMGNITPFKSGEAVTPLLFKKYLKIPVGRGFSIVILDRFFELMVFAVILFLVVFYVLNLGIQNSMILSVFRAILIVLLLFMVILIVLVISKRSTFKIIGLFNFLRRYSPARRILEFFDKELDTFYDALSLFKNKKVYRFMVSLTLIGWFFEMLSIYFVFSSILSVSLITVFVAQIITAGAAFITFIPGGIGVNELSTVYMLSLFGYDKVLALSGILLARVFLTGTLVFAGLVGSALIKEKKIRNNA